MTRYKIMKNMENEQEKGKIYFRLWTLRFEHWTINIELWGLNIELYDMYLLPLTIEVWTLNFMICTVNDYEFL